MLNPVDFSGRPFHFIGIGGIGMSALAYVLRQRQLPVSGSDVRLSHITQRLQEAGAHIFWKQDADNLLFFQADRAEQSPKPSPNGNGHAKPQAVLPTTMAGPQTLPQVVCSTAINDNNSEYRAARNLGCPIFHRSDILAALMQQYRSIAIAGTHGKTTTSSMMGYALLEAGLDPTVVIGGEVGAWKGNARLGDGEWLVAEADESDGSLVKLVPEIGVITNIELDHPDHYQDLDQVIDIFRQFAQQTKVTVASADCPTIRAALTPTLTYSLHRDRAADIWVDRIDAQPAYTEADVWERGTRLGRLRLSVPGQHNLSNALAVIAVGRHLGVEFSHLAAGLAQFEGARRRFELRGYHNGIQFIDDYAHHPSEIQATLSVAALQRAGSSTGSLTQRVVAVFQPHRYSRTAAFLSEFSQAFGQADVVLVTDIYSAGETNTHGITGETLHTAIAAHHPQVHYCPSLEAVNTTLADLLQPGDMALFLGAGNLNRIIPDVMAPFVEAEARTVQRA